MKRETFLNKEVGFKFKTAALAVTQPDLDAFYRLWGKTETLFTSDEFAQSQELNFKGRIVAGLFLVGVMLGKLDMLEGAGFAFDAAMVGMNEIKFIAPAYCGDRLHLEGELLTRRTTSKGHIVVTWRWTLVNQDNTAVTSGVNTEIFARAMTA
ncbi:MAG: MaoC family dehydratase [Dehalococcoidales bacterium]|nr:MaoC family dehydratase [Dehalococcoidales bacterium]